MNGEKKVAIYGKEFDVNAEVKVINSLSAHGDYEEIIRYLSCQDISKVKELFLVHGDPDVQYAFKKRLKYEGFKKISIPSIKDQFYIWSLLENTIGENHIKSKKQEKGKNKIKNRAGSNYCDSL